MGIMLRHTSCCMPQHFRYVFEFDIIGQGDGCGKSVAAGVVGDFLGYACRFRPFLEVLVHIAEIDQCVEHMTVRGGIFLFRR